MTAAAVRPEPTTKALTLVREKVSSILLNDEARRQISPLLSQGVSLERVVSTIHQVVADNPELLECTPESLVMAVGKGVKWDLDFGETVHLVPFNVKVSKRNEADRFEKRAKAIRDYKGDIELVVRSGAARAVDAQCFYENEPFKYEQGTRPYIEHHPIVDTVKRGKMLGAYGWALISQRAPLKISVMSVEEIDKIRQEKSKSWKNGPLPDWYARKTMVHQVTKSIPKNPKLAEVLSQFEEEEIADADFEVEGLAPDPAVTETTSPVASSELMPPDETTDPDLMTLEQAKATKLAGPPGSWSGKAGELLDSFSNKHLESIRSWCAQKLEESPNPDPAKELMVNAITLILDDRAKEQETLQFDSKKTADAIDKKQNGNKKKDDKGGLPF